MECKKLKRASINIELRSRRGISSTLKRTTTKGKHLNYAYTQDLASVSPLYFDPDTGAGRALPHAVTDSDG